MERALPIDEYVAFDSSVEDTGDISNMTAEQYLSWVRYQADEMPDVFRAEIDSSLYTGKQTKYMPDIEKVDVCPEHLLPSTEWERDVIVAFSDLRALLARLSLSEASRERKLVVPQLKDEQAWHKFCLGSEYCTDSRSNMSGQMDIDGSKIPSSSSFDIEQRKLELSESLGITKSAGDIDDSAVVTTDASPEDDSDEEEGVDCKAQKSVPDGYPTWSGVEDSLPTTSLLLQFDQVMTQRLLGYQVSWLQERDTLTSARGQWLYGLLARLEKPLDRNLASLMRELYRTCSHLRATIDEDDSKFDVQIASLNVLIAITGSYFGQGEEYSTLSTGYGDDEEEDDEDEDDEDNDDDYYFTGEGEGDIEPFQGVYRIGDDIWNDPVTMAVETNPSQSRELEGSGNNYDNSSFLRKRTAENSAEEGEEVEEEGGDIL